MPALKLRLRTTCATCGNPIPLTSAHLPVACPTCDAVSAMGFGAFAWVVLERVSARGPSEDAALLGDAEPSDVACPVCRAVASDEAIEKGLAQGELACGCGNVVQVRAVPDEIDPNGWWTALVGETSRAKRAPSEAPVHFACTQCGGALLVDGTTRTPTCRFCNTRVYVPDDLWRALRPTPRAEPFYLWVDSAWSERWDARERRARNASLAVGVTGTALAIAAGIATCAAGYQGSSDNEPGVAVFFIVWLSTAV